MAKRPINLDSNGPPPGPSTMAELLTAAEAAWKAGEKQRGFITMLGACAMMSAGVAQSLKACAELHRELAEIKAKLAEKE